MPRKPFPLSRRRTGSLPKRRAFRPTLEVFEARRLLSANVLTYHNDGAQSGLNPDETVLTPSNVNSADFGKIFSVPVDGQIYAQPLYVSGLAIPGQGTHNVVFVVTEHDSVYAFDSDTGSLIWHDSFINPSAGVTTVPKSALTGDFQIKPEVGISSTPVIDPTTNTLYVVAYTQEVSGSTTSYVYRLHALDVTTGAEKFGGPVEIQAEDNGTGEGNDGDGHVLFDAYRADQRSGLLLLNGVVYVGFASWGDTQPYHGWLIGYNAQTLQQAAVFDATPNGSEGGIWMSEGAPATDGTYIYLMTGNGTFDTTMDANGFPIQGDYGDSFIKLAADPSTSPINQNINGWGLKVVDYFTPSNELTLDENDLDLGSGGLILLPDQPGPYPHELVGAGKQGTIYVIDRDNMGKFDPNGDNVVQEIDNALPGGSFDTPAYFNGQVYYGGAGDYIKAFQVTNGLLSTSPTSQSGNTFQIHGTTPSVSANGTADGVVWALDNSTTSASSPAVLYAYNATNLADELYNSTQVASRDQAGPGLRFVPPIVANGKVYVATADELDVYGPLSSVEDTGFEQVQVGAGQFQYRPTGSPWTFSGGSGISGNNSGFTSGNPPAPQGSQVAFLQSTGSFSQRVTGFETGTYVLTFEAAQRENIQASQQNFNVLIDGSVVGTFTPSGTSYQSYTTDEFSVAVGAHTISFQGLDSAGGDNTAFVDAVALVNVSQIADPGFEQVVVGTGQFQYRPTGSPWTFSGTAGLAGNDSGFTSGNPPAPEGSQVAFLQGTGSFTQSVTGWAAGSYVLTFDAAQRGTSPASQQNFNVLVDSTVVGTFKPSGTSYQSYTTATFTVTAGTHTITFQGLDSVGGDNTALIDLVAVTGTAPPVVTSSIGDPGFEQVVVGAGQFQYRATGSPWAFTGTSGISGNNSGFTSGNPSAPQGVQVAFLQETGSFSQSVAGWAAG
ncbi:MAG: hypothetical protein WBX00_33630, partial [Isosphaeraceae bacterium]